MSLLRSVILTTMIAMFMFVTACQSGGTATRQVVDDSAPTQSQIADKLADGFLLEPRVSVEVTNYRPFYILGEVGRPGEYPFNSGLTVLNAVAAAGGFTYRANKKVVYIKSVGADQEVKYELNTNTVVKPGDTLRVSERIF